MFSIPKSLHCTVILAVLALTGCAGHERTGPKRSIQVAEAKGSAPISAKDQATLHKCLNEELYSDLFNRGNEFTLEYKISKYDRGNRALRYLVGFGAGKGSVVVEAFVLDSKKKVIASKVVDGDQSVGFFGGSFDGAIEELAENLAEEAAIAIYPGRN